MTDEMRSPVLLFDKTMTAKFCKYFAVLLQYALQCHCKRLAVRLQQACSVTAKGLQ